MKTIKNITVLLIAAILFNSCATILRGSKQTVFVNSNQPKTEVYIKNKLVATTPALIEIKKKTKQIVFKQTGFNDYTHNCKTKIDAAYFGNVLFLGLMPIGFSIDLLSGACVKQKEVNINAVMEKSKK